MTAWGDDIEHVREQVARLVGSDVGDIAFTQNTPTGLSVAANGIDWRPGDNVVLPEREFRTNYYPWFNLQPRRVHFRRVPVPARPGHPQLLATAPPATAAATAAC